MPRKSLAERLDAKRQQLEKINEEIASLEQKEAERLGRLAVKAGLADVQIADDDLSKGLQELASRFRENAKPAQPPQGQG